MISKSISWSTAMNFWSHSLISVVLLRVSSCSSEAGRGSFWWCEHHSRTCQRAQSVSSHGRLLDNKAIPHTFFNTGAVTWTGISSFVSPRSIKTNTRVKGCRSQRRAVLSETEGVTIRTVKHVSDEVAALHDIDLDDEFLLVGGDEGDGRLGGGCHLNDDECEEVKERSGVVRA